MSAEISFAFKVGATFQAEMTRTRDDGSAWNLTNTTITSQLRRRDGTLLADLTVAKLDQGTKPGVWTALAASAVTATWPVGETVEWDWRYVEADGTVEHSPTLLVRLRRRVTR